MPDKRDLQADLNRLLDSLFNGQAYNRQARYIVGIGAHTVALLRDIQRFVSTRSERGTRMKDYPLHLVGIGQDSTELDRFRAELEGLDPLCCIAEGDEGLADCLLKLDVSDAAHCLFVAAPQDPNWELASLEAAGLARSYGCLVLRSSSDAAQSLAHEAERGYLPTPGGAFSYPKAAACARELLVHYRKRPQTVRAATSGDLDQLVAIEEACWPPRMRQSRDGIKRRLEEAGRSCLVLELDEQVVASAYAQRIDDVEDLMAARSSEFDQLLSAHGPVLQLIAVNQLPGTGHPQLEREFLEYCLQVFLATDHVEEVAAVLRCENYPGPDVISFPSYVEELKASRGSADLATRMHVEHGAEILACARAYRASDEDNLGYGVLVSYSRLEREVSASRVSAAAFDTAVEFTPDSIAQRVDERIKAFSAGASYTRHALWLELGMSSTAQLELRADLSRQFAIDLPHNFLDQYADGQAVIDYLIDQKIRTFKSWLYETRWLSTAKPTINALPAGQHWLCFVDGSDFSSSLCERLRERGQRVTQIIQGPDYVQHPDGTIQLNPCQPGCMKQLFVQLGEQAVHAAIYLWGRHAEADFDLHGPQHQHEESISGLTQLANELMLSAQDSHPRLWVLTQSTVQDGSTAALREWPLGALCKVIADEYPQLSPSYLAIDASRSSTESADTVIDELRAGSKEPFVAFRQGKRRIPRLVRLSHDGLRLPQLSPKARYLIIGGLRPLGLLMARWHVAKGARRLILAGESEIGTEAKLLINELREQGIQVLTPHFDIEDGQALKQALEQINQDGIPLKGVMHAAGMVDNDLLLRMTWERFHRVHRLKVHAAWALHEATEHLDLDHFIMWSSCLPDIAPISKANHATGNSFIDALAHYRHKRGLPALAIDCGPWDLRHIEVQRIDPLSKTEVIHTLQIETGLQLLDHLYYSSKAQVTAAAIEWQKLLHERDEPNPLFEEIAVELGYQRVPLLEQVRAAADEQKSQLLLSYLHEAVRRVLGLPSGSSLELREPLAKLGLTRQQCTRLRKRISFDLQDIITLPFDFVSVTSTLHDLAKHLDSRLEKAAQAYPPNAVAMIVQVDGGYALRMLDGTDSDGKALDAKDAELDRILRERLFQPE